MYSMTGFGKAELSGNRHKVVVELKTVNHRFKDFRFRLSSALSSQELAYRRLLESEFQRGSFDVAIFLKGLSEDAALMDIDDHKIEAFIKHFKEIGRKTHVEFDFRPGDFLRAEFQKDIEQQSGKGQEIEELAIKALKMAVVGLKESRREEGRKLIQVIDGHLAQFQKYFHVIEQNVDLYKQQVEERLRKKFKEFSSELKIDEPRFMQEVVFYLEKLDVHEEINRLKSHVLKFKNLIGHGEEKGREIEFLLQEMGRETNTIGSKSGQGTITDMVVQMKVQLEKMREQSLNIE